MDSANSKCPAVLHTAASLSYLDKTAGKNRKTALLPWTG